MALKGNGAQIKGKAGERELAKLLLSWCNETNLPDLPIKRNLMQSMEGGHDLTGVPDWAIEVKRQETVSLPAWWRQAVNSAKTLDAVPILAWRQNRRPWFFRARVWVAHYGEQRSSTHQLDVDMTADQFRQFFLYHVWANVVPSEE